MLNINDIHVCIFGMGYVGLPLAVEFARHFPVVGFDLDKNRVLSLQSHIDETGEVVTDELIAAKNLKFTCDIEDAKVCNFFIICVPTPVDSFNKPDLSKLKQASESVAVCINDGDFVVYESTVYPGCTEEECIPIIEKKIKKKLNKDFYCGYSPERVNPGDRNRTIASIVKVTSGSCIEAAELIDSVYKKVIPAGTYLAESIMVAEAAKVIENTQRDINIALMNELSIIFNLLKIDTNSVLNAASTKWNFMRFSPGLVGGHCIGVDPYYLTYKAQSIGYHPEIILAGRRLNDSMGVYVASQLIKGLINKRIEILGSSILIMGFSFKENCQDIRNTKVIDIYRELVEFGCCVEIYDPVADVRKIKNEYGISCISNPKTSYYDAIILAVPHSKFISDGIDKINLYGKENYFFYDIKSSFPIKNSSLRL